MKMKHLALLGLLVTGIGHITFVEAAPQKQSKKCTCNPCTCTDCKCPDCSCKSCNGK